jgi:hypothetical protein
MQIGSNRKRPGAPGANGAGNEPHGNAGPFGPPSPIKQEDRLSHESVHGGLMSDCYGTASDMSVKKTGT